MQVSNDINTVWQPIPNSSQALALDTRCSHTLYHGARGPGKRLANDQLVLTDAGWKRACDIVMADKLVAPDGSYTALTGIYPGNSENFYRFTFDDGAQSVVCSEHRWAVADSKQFAKSGWFVRTTAQLLKLKGRYGVPYIDAPVQGEAWKGFDPYAVGLMLGDGTMGSKHLCIYSVDEFILNYMKDNHGWVVYRYPPQCPRVTCLSKETDKVLRALLPKVKAGDKSVPLALLVADPASRLAVLQGLMDSDGTVEKTGNKCRFVSKSEQLARDVADLVRSLGGKASCYYEYRHSPRGGENGRWRVNFTARNMFCPFRLPRKAQRCVPTRRVQRIRYIESIEEVAGGSGVCFSVAHPSHLFVIKDYVVTHNTDTQLMRFRRRVGLGYGVYWRGVIFDREYKNLDDLVSKSKRWFSRFNDGAKFLEAAKDYKWVWPTGEELLFRVAKKDNDYWNYHGQEFPYLGWNELTKYPTSKLYDDMMSTNRSSFLPEKDTPKRLSSSGKFLGYATPDGNPLPDIPLEVFSTANPYGVGHGWVKRRFIDVGPPGTVVRTKTRVFNPRTQEEDDVVRTQVAIFGSYRENIYLSPEYVAELEGITDENKRQAWLMGNWNIVAGGAFDDVWKQQTHVIPRFKVPAGWHVDRAFDWGSTHPFSVGWFAEANGEEVILPDGRVFCPAAGSIIQIAEWYGTKEPGSNKGLVMSARKVAEGIVEREEAMMAGGWIKSKPWAGPADNQIRNVIEDDSDTIEEKMAGAGVRWTQSDKSAGSRKNGLELIRNRLEASITGEGPGLYFMQNCITSVGGLPTLPRDEDDMDDVDTEAEDHFYDMLRYRVLKGNNRMARSITVRYVS